MDLQEPGAKMSTTSGTDAGLVYIDDEPDAIRKKIKRAQDSSGTEIVRAPDKPGITNLIDMLAVARATAPDAIEREFESGLRCAEDGRGGGARGCCAGQRYRSCAPTRPASRTPSPGRRAGARDRLPHDGRGARGDGNRTRLKLRLVTPITST